MRQSRTAKSIKNSFVATLFYFFNLILQFCSRKIFIDCLGTEILGLNTTAMNLLQFLNLAELGIGGAVAFSLFKPIQEQDNNTVNKIIALQGFLYRRIALMIIIGALILMCFFPLIFKKINLPLWYTYASFITLLFSALLGYFVNYKQVLLSASQQDYKIHYSYKSIMMIKILCQSLAVYFFHNGYVWWLILEIIFAIIASWTLNIVIVKSFPNLGKVKESIKSLKSEYKELVVKIKQLFFHKIGYFVLSQTSPLIIYAYVSLSMVTIYGNYLMIVNGVTQLINAVFNSFGAAVGNLVAEGDDQKIRVVFKELFSLRFVIVITLCFQTYYITTDFITLWIGAKYVLPNSILIIITLTLFISLFRFTIDAFTNAYGLFQDIYAPIVEAVLNLGLSIILGYFYSLKGILVGVFISQIIIVGCWKPYFLFTRKMNGMAKTYIWLYIKHLFCASIAWFFTILIMNSINWDIEYPIIRIISKIILSTVIFLSLLCIPLISLKSGLDLFYKRIIHRIHY